MSKTAFIQDYLSNARVIIEDKIYQFYRNGKFLVFLDESSLSIEEGTYKIYSDDKNVILDSSIEINGKKKQKIIVALESDKDGYFFPIES